MAQASAHYDSGRPTVTINWPAIFAGWLVATGIAWLFYVLGLALGFSSVDLSNVTGTAPQPAWGIGTRVWLFATWTISLFMGGMFAAWFDGKNDQTVGALHGIAVWGLATTVTAILAGLGSIGVLQGGASLVHGVLGATKTAATTAQGMNANDLSLGPLQASIRRGLTDARAKSAMSPPSAGGPVGSGSDSAQSAVSSGAAPNSTQLQTPNRDSVDPQVGTAVATDLVGGNMDRAKARLTAEGLSSAQVDQLLQATAAQRDLAIAQAKQVADRTARYVATALWAVFVSTALGLIAAALGGWLGAGHIHHVYDVTDTRIGWPQRRTTAA